MLCSGEPSANHCWPQSSAWPELPFRTESGRGAWSFWTWHTCMMCVLASHGSDLSRLCTSQALIHPGGFQGCLGLHQTSGRPTKRKKSCSVPRPATKGRTNTCRRSPPATPLSRAPPLSRALPLSPPFPPLPLSSRTVAQDWLARRRLRVAGIR